MSKHPHYELLNLATILTNFIKNFNVLVNLSFVSLYSFFRYREETASHDKNRMSLFDPYFENNPKVGGKKLVYRFKKDLIDMMLGTKMFTVMQK